MDFLSGFELRDAIDILIVAFLIYRVLLLLRGTRAVRVALGLLLVFVVYSGARWFELRTLDWLLSNIFTYIVFAIIVLFQSELRRMLASIGQTPFFRGLAASTPRQPLDDIVAASTAMAAERRGRPLRVHWPVLDRLWARAHRDRHGGRWAGRAAWWSRRLAVRARGGA